MHAGESNMRCLAMLLFLAVAMPAQTPAPETKGTIRGTVTDTNGTPVEAATVEVRAPVAGNKRASVGGSDLTDETGSYAIADLEPANYTVTIKMGREELSVPPRRVTLEAGKELSLDLIIPAMPTISGHVVDQNKEPVVEAFVWLLKPDFQGGTLKQVVIGPKATQEDGSYTFDTGIEPNRRYFVLVDRPPADELLSAMPADLKEREPIEVSTYYPNATRLDAATPLILQPGEHREQVDIKVATAPFYCVQGKIQLSGKPASSSYDIFEAALAGTGLRRLRSRPDSDGAYRACGLTPGAYRLSTDEGFTDFVISDADRNHIDLSSEVAHLQPKAEWDGDPPPAQDLPKLDQAAEQALRAIAKAAGEVLSSDDDLKQFEMRFRDMDKGLMARLRETPPDGVDVSSEFQYLMGRLHRFPDMIDVTLGGGPGSSGPSFGFAIPPPPNVPPRVVPAGEYTLDVQLMGPYESYVKEVTYNGVKVTDGILRIAPAATGTLQFLIARNPASLTVTVTDSDGKPMPDAPVVVVPESVTTLAALARVVTRAATEANGTLTMSTLPPGKYRVLATTQSVRWGVPEDLEKVLLVLYQAKTVELNEKDKVQIAVSPIPI
jgi:protocatechuate 3,4-dioxygenase beta subunit